MLHSTLYGKVKPNTLRYRLPHVDARITRGLRRLLLRLDSDARLVCGGGRPKDQDRGWSRGSQRVLRVQVDLRQ